MKRLLVGILLVLNSNYAMSGEVVASIERVSSGGWNAYYTIRTDSNYNPANCPNNPQYWFMEKSNQFADSWLSIALTAYTSGKPVSAWIDDSTCLEGFPKVLRFTIGGSW